MRINSSTITFTDGSSKYIRGYAVAELHHPGAAIFISQGLVQAFPWATISNIQCQEEEA